eukprot:CAMPEP_0204843590 /NCGR_PEP_ID=MMETSP1346-20131115/48066_1 /ASSEMBLY_ACC=CAM_ASM_000771 /TAXON_ID=215587 /ORGANISM="Aplanochytrium stocchinoi, Strain GSBS06" /LENGTH=130 /DNA_ID=CAMNT_0051982753 /DNA_START=264 /DNA_END=656 /DNA_ORIENTATION=-
MVVPAKPNDRTANAAKFDGIKGKLHRVLTSPQGVEISKRNKRVTTQFKGGQKAYEKKTPSELADSSVDTPLVEISKRNKRVTTQFKGGQKAYEKKTPSEPADSSVDTLNKYEKRYEKEGVKLPMPPRQQA